MQVLAIAVKLSVRGGRQRERLLVGYVEIGLGRTEAFRLDSLLLLLLLFHCVAADLARQRGGPERRL